MITISVSQIQRELHRLNDFDIIEIADRKRGKIKGYFLDIRYKDIIDKIVKKQKKSSLSLYSGMWKDRDIDQNSLREKAWKK